MSGKGDTPRPYSVSADVFSENYCRTFGHKPRNGRCINCGAKAEASPNKIEAANGYGQSDPQGSGQAEGIG